MSEGHRSGGRVGRWYLSIIPCSRGAQIGQSWHKPRISSGIQDLLVATRHERPQISLYYSLLTGIDRIAVRSGLDPPPQGLYPLESAIYVEPNSPHLAQKSRFCEQSENQGHRDCPAVSPEFSERNSGSYFFRWKWTAGSMSRLGGDVELQTRSLKNGYMDIRFEIPLGLARAY